MVSLKALAASATTSFNPSAFNPRSSTALFSFSPALAVASCSCSPTRAATPESWSPIGPRVCFPFPLREGSGNGSARCDTGNRHQKRLLLQNAVHRIVQGRLSAAGDPLRLRTDGAFALRRHIRTPRKRTNLPYPLPAGQNRGRTSSASAVTSFRLPLWWKCVVAARYDGEDEFSASTARRQRPTRAGLRILPYSTEQPFAHAAAGR